MIENETLTAENVEVDLETLEDAQSYGENLIRRNRARDKIVEAVIEALYPDDKAKLDLYMSQ